MTAMECPRISHATTYQQWGENERYDFNQIALL
jgi:hypothetical protein